VLDCACLCWIETMPAELVTPCELAVVNYSFVLTIVRLTDHRQAFVLAIVRRPVTRLGLDDLDDGLLCHLVSSFRHVSCGWNLVEHSMVTMLSQASLVGDCA